MKFFKDNPIKNSLLAVGLMLFLTICFKLSGDLTNDSMPMSQTDSVFSEIRLTNTMPSPSAH